ncbi:MAG: NAD(P)-dependent oxidoreductase [Candidatus Omnitrophica bacterium]|nr:NAD(P)-dependent oxidoreductase [Candidatus Omnitrophota bacterium]
MKVLITGATGFIGSHLAKRLVLDHEVFCLIRSRKKAQAVLPGNIVPLSCDISDSKGLKKILTCNFDVIYHCAGYVSNKDRLNLYKVNVLGTENICRLALDLNVRRFVHLSSIAVVAGNSEANLVEDLPYRAGNIYGESKIESEKVALKYKREGLSTAVLRPCMVYGEDEPHLLRTLLFLVKHKLYPLLNGGENLFHLVYVENVVDAMILASSKNSFLEKPVFVADKEVLKLKDVADIMADAIGAKRPLRFPRSLTPFFIKLPLIGDKFKLLIKDRSYSTERLLSYGFQHRFSTQEALYESCRNMFYGAGI